MKLNFYPENFNMINHVSEEAITKIYFKLTIRLITAIYEHIFIYFIQYSLFVREIQSQLQLIFNIIWNLFHLFIQDSIAIWREISVVRNLSPICILLSHKQFIEHLTNTVEHTINHFHNTINNSKPWFLEQTIA